MFVWKRTSSCDLSAPSLLLSEAMEPILREQLVHPWFPAAVRKNPLVAPLICGPAALQSSKDWHTKDTPGKIQKHYTSRGYDSLAAQPDTR